MDNTTEKTYLAQIVATDDQGTETTSTIPLKLRGEPVVEYLEQKLDQEYPHLKHKITELKPLKTPDAVEDWQHSYLGAVFGSEHESNEREDYVDKL